jgi:hypothetical protein
MLLLLAGPMLARPALADEPASDGEEEEATLARSAPLSAREDGDGAATALGITGTTFIGLGAATFLAAGITWTVAAASAARADQECPNDRCVEGTIGADSLRTARDAEKGADVLVGIGAPVLATGLVLAIVARGLRSGSKRAAAVTAAPVVGSTGGGAVVHVRF